MILPERRHFLLPFYVYSGLVRCLLSYYLFTYLPINAFWKSILLIPLDLFDPSHILNAILTPSHLGYEANISNTLVDKWVDFITYVLFYLIVFEPVAPSYMKSIVLFFLLYRLIGVLIYTVGLDRHIFFYFPDFINSSYIVFTFYLVYIKSDPALLWTLFFLSIVFKVWLESYLIHKYTPSPLDDPTIDSPGSSV